MTRRNGQDRAQANGHAPRLTRALGWASLGLGAAQLAAPDAVRRLAGVDDSATARVVVPLVGARELVHAAGLLRGRHPAAWSWSRVAGDAMDLAALGTALAGRRGERRQRLTAVTVAIAGITAVDLATAYRASRRKAGPLHLQASVTVQRPADEVYRYWRMVENLPTFMIHLVSVTDTGGGRSHWVATAPAGRTVEWDAEITEDRPGEVIAWRSLPGTKVPNRGAVRFSSAPGDRGTEVRVQLDYDVPGGRFGNAVARLFGEQPAQQIRDDLRRFKQILETGEIARSAGSPEGTRSLRQVTQKPARPLAGVTGR